MAARAARVPRPIIIQPPSRWPKLELAEIWAYRGLLFFLVWRDIKVRYAQTVLGAGWTVIQPIVTMVVFTIIFGRLIGVPSDGAPYQVFALAALTPWNYFSSAFSAASGSLAGSANLITKVYFPRLVVPLAPLLSGLVNFGITLAVLSVVMAYFNIVPSVSAIVVLPLLCGIMMATALGMGCWLTALHIQYRDVGHLVRFLVHIWMYASPVVYPMSVVPEPYRMPYAVNPMAGVIEGFRAVLLGTQPVPWDVVGVGAITAALLCISGLYYFRRTEWRFADVA